MFHADGRLPRGPLAVVEVQGYAYAALEAMSELAAVRSDQGRRAAWSARAQRLLEAIEHSKEVHIERPVLPIGIESLSIRDLPVGNVWIDLEFHRIGEEVAAVLAKHLDGGVRVLAHLVAQMTRTPPSRKIKLSSRSSPPGRQRKTNINSRNGCESGTLRAAIQ